MVSEKMIEAAKRADREAIARIIDPHNFMVSGADYGVDDEGFKTTWAYMAQQVSLKKADQIIAALSTDAEPVGWFNPWNDYHGYQQVAKEFEGTPGKIPLYAAPPAPSVAVKTPFEVASKHIPEARVSLLSRAIRQGLNDYGWKNFGTLPEMLMSYIVQAEKAEANAHPQKPRDCGQEGGDLIERRANIGSAYTRSALSAQVQDVAIPEGWQLVPKEPTEKMHIAARDWAIKKYGMGVGTDGSDGCYRAMLAAAPAAKQGEGE